MSSEVTEKVISDLVRDEGYRQYPYRCTAGRLTIGIGRNIDDVGVSKAEAEYLLVRDILSSTTDLQTIFTEFNTFPDDIQRVLINMRFQLGFMRFRAFKKMIEATRNRQWSEMARQMKDSSWYSQVPERAQRLIKLVEGVR